jgi:tetratricopeptide (TPR) repeat protein
MRRTAIVLTVGLGLAALSLWLTRAEIDSTRGADNAFQRGDYAAAVRAYQDAAESCHDLPALAGNQAAALYRLDRYDDADRRYQLAATSNNELQSAKATYCRGNCALRQACPAEAAPDKTLLDQAAEQFSACLSHEGTVGDQVTADARHNLELTKLLRLPPDATQPGVETARNDPQTGDKQDSSGATPDAKRESSTDRTPVLSESRKPSNLLAGLTAHKDDGDYLCPD